MSRGVAKDTFSRLELRLILQVAPTIVYMRRDPASDSPFDSIPDPTFVDRTFRTLLFSACHIKHLGELSSRDVDWFETPDWKGWVLRWHRAKTDVPVVARIPRNDVLPWLREYLDLPKPRTQQAYYQLMAKVAQRIEAATSTPGHQGVRIRINPLRFRHTGIAINKGHGLTDRETAETAGTTLDTVQMYASEKSGLILAKLERAGHDDVFGRLIAERSDSL